MSSQKERVLKVLHATGGHGTAQVDWLRWPTPDGGPPITRLAARIGELQNDGFVIAPAGLRGKTRVYVLVREPAGGSVGRPSEIAEADTPAALFDVPAAPPVNALDDDWEAA